MNPPRVYMSSHSWTLLPPPSPYHLFGSSQCTSPKHPVSCIEPRLAIHFLYDIIHVSVPFSQIIPPSPSPTESKSLFYTSVSLLLSRIQGYHYHLSKFHICVCWLWYFQYSGRCMQTNTATMENSVEIPLKIANRTALWSSNPTAGHTHLGQNWKRHIYPNVHCSTVYNSQDMEAT